MPSTTSRWTQEAFLVEINELALASIQWLSMIWRPWWKVSMTHTRWVVL